MKDIFAAKEYRKFLKSWLDLQNSSRGLLSRMAEALGCQNSHLTRLLRDEVHLTPDQALATCKFLKLTESETNYFLNLVDFERAATPALRERLRRELDALQLEQENLSKRFKKSELGTLEKEMTYYSAWFWAAIHVATDIPRYQTPRSLAARLGLDEGIVRNCLETLEKFSLVKREANDVWKISSTPIHLPKTSPMNPILHSNWRARAIQNSQGITSDSLHYTVVQSLGIDDFTRVKQSLLESIDRYRKIADPSPAEELVCFTCDFFRV